jgi:hypothetical protein
MHVQYCYGREEIIDLIEKFLKKSVSQPNCTVIWSDGAVALKGMKKECTARVKEVPPHAVFQHCMKKRLTSVAKKLQLDINKVLQDAVSVVNFIKARALNSR